MTLLLGKKKALTTSVYMLHVANLVFIRPVAQQLTADTHKERFAFSAVTEVTWKEAKLTIIISPLTCRRTIPSKVTVLSFLYLNMQTKAIISLQKIIFP